MIRRGRQDNILLFEITEQDLLDTEVFPTSYQAGNVLLFDHHQSVRIGLELARADDLSCALEFLSIDREIIHSNVAADAECTARCDKKTTCKEVDSCLLHSLPNNMTLQGACIIDEIDLLKQRLEQRDGLLSDFAEQLKLQQEENELLNLLLEQTQSQIELEAASRDELMDDLRYASASTQMIEDNLERVIEEKFRLEQELAEKITALIESSMQNDDLRRQVDFLKEPKTTIGTTLLPNDLPDQTRSRNWTDDKSVGSETELELLPSEQQINQTLTMSSGKLIHIYHEFPTLVKRRPQHTFKLITRTILKSTAVLALVVLCTLVCSVLATSLNGNISFGQALDLIMDSALSWIG